MISQIERDKILIKQVREKCSKTAQPNVSIVVTTNKLKYSDNIFDNYERLSYPNKELIIILNNNDMNMEEYKIKAEKYKDVRVFQLDEEYSLGECLNHGIEHSRYSFISKMDDDDYYGANYFTDIMNAFKYTEAQVVGKAARFIYYEATNVLTMDNTYYENKYVPSSLTAATITAKKEVFKRIKFKKLKCGEGTVFLQECAALGVRMYATDKYNYVYIRHADLDSHTFKIPNEELIKTGTIILKTTDFTPIVSV